MTAMATMIIFTLSILISTTIANDFNNLRYNSLLSAQCKARCLYEYRHYQHRTGRALSTDGQMKRLLANNALTNLPWRSIWERCPRLITCSSCLLPCDLDPPLLLSNDQTCQAICSTSANVECQRSCHFIQNLYRQASNCLTDDCQSCSSSNDCFEKIPQPSNVTATERKSRRTVRLKWTSNGVTHNEPVFYVIEAQWRLAKSESNEQEMVSKWGFVKEEVSHTKAIIRNIQRDQRWYTFRVAAVTRHGHSAFSATTKPFRLSSETKNQSEEFEVKIPPPRQFLIKDALLDGNTVNVSLTWQEPDFPINGYQISWQTENDLSSSSINTIDLSSTIYPLELTIPSLSMHTTYLFKIRSLIIPHGDQIRTSEAVTIRYNYEEELFSIKDFRLSPPYFINGLIKMNISWNKIDNDRLEQYNVHWIETKCYSDVLSCCYRRDAIARENSFQLYDLRFNCTYILNIQPIVSQTRLKKSFQTYFNVSSCQSIGVQGTIRPPCQNEKSSRLPSMSSSLNLLIRRNQTGLDLSWENLARSTLDGTSVYQLRIEQLPNRLELLSVDLSPMINNYFFSYIPQQTNRYLNITLTSMQNGIIQDQQSVLVEEYVPDYRPHRNLQYNLVSSSSKSGRIDWILIGLLLTLIDLIRRNIGER